MKGKVKFYNRSKDFGFIASDEGVEYYFNAASMRMPQEDDRVEFEIQKTARGEVAKMVTSEGGASCGTKTCGSRLKCMITLLVIAVAAFALGHYI